VHGSSNLFLIVLLLPLLSFFISYALAKLHKPLVPVIASVLAVCTFAACILFMQHDAQVQQNTAWWTVGGVDVLHWKIDALALSMGALVTFISMLVHIYSIEYMKSDSGRSRYFAWLGFFTFSMLGIVFSGHFLLTFIFWELVGVSSYVIIGHYRTQWQAGAAATKAFLFNRAGDAGFFIALGLLFARTGSLQYDTAALAYEPNGWFTWIGIGIFCGVIGKSAQFPLFTWLPDAMRGPTPASALIHAATMVAAGVFLVARVYFIFTPVALLIIGMIGGLTALWAGIEALKSFDLKKILAWSTVSQLGFMLLSMSSGLPHAGIIHLFTHAFFKAGLFLCAGIIIHSREHLHAGRPHEDAQDIRTMSGLRHQIPIVSAAFLLCAASLAGLPLSSGFLSKDAIYSSLLVSNLGPPWAMISTVIVAITSLLTVFYSFRAVWFLFIKDVSPSAKAKKIQVPFYMLTPVVMLSVASLWFMVSISPVDFAGPILHVMESVYGEGPRHSVSITFLSIAWIALALLFSFYFWRKKEVSYAVSIPLPAWDHWLKSFVRNPLRHAATITLAIDRKWIDRVIHSAVYFQVMIAHVVAWLDRYLVDGIIQLVARVTALLGMLTRSFIGGKIQSYIFWALCGVIIFILWSWLY